MSNKSARYGRFNTVINVLTVVVAALVTFIGFYGAERVYNVVANEWQLNVPQESFFLLFNLVSFSLLVLVFLQVFFRFGERQQEADRAIVELSSFINFVIDRQNENNDATAVAYIDLELIQEKYKSIIASIPSNTDQEYKDAKAQEQRTELTKTGLELGILGSRTKEAAALRSVIYDRSDLLEALNLLHNYRDDLWIGGGVFRNAVWDSLHQYSLQSQIDDIDVVYFDPKFVEKSFDEKIEAELRALAPNIAWSVKNQARMHKHNDDSPYAGLEDAISKWPETCTSFCIRIDEVKDIQIICPHNLTDLFSLIVKPTPHFMNRTERLKQRISEKQWKHRWPRLRFFL
jgi:hypothetical protein